MWFLCHLCSLKATHLWWTPLLFRFKGTDAYLRNVNMFFGRDRYYWKDSFFFFQVLIVQSALEYMLENQFSFMNTNDLLFHVRVIIYHFYWTCTKIICAKQAEQVKAALNFTLMMWWSSRQGNECYVKKQQQQSTTTTITIVVNKQKKKKKIHLTSNYFIRVICSKPIVAFFFYNVVTFTV